MQLLQLRAKLLRLSSRQRRRSTKKRSTGTRTLHCSPPPVLFFPRIVVFRDPSPCRYFTSPQQLLDIFSALEERNLFLIQNSQETEEALEELRQKLEDTKSKMTSETGSLASQIQTLQVIFSPAKRHI
jgi:hypothetical protein